MITSRDLNKKMEENSSCGIEDPSKSCCNCSPKEAKGEELKSHWDTAYQKKPENQLGWFEQDFAPTLRLLDQCEFHPNDSILLVGSGVSRLPDLLLKKGLSEIYVTDISEIAINEVKARLGNQIQYKLGDILDEKMLEEIPSVQVWFDRAVLHFFTDEKDREVYFRQLKQKVKSGGYVILAEFHLDGAKKCSGLPVFGYTEALYQEQLGDEFKLLDSFDFDYIMPSGEKRPYVYALYQRKNSGSSDSTLDIL
ncbi:methyltransferase domain-containing protein [Algoriphagus pacificus]|uniref:Methyltransferase domain-containing protein n=1 Tax=Algoriphagus pacificus TaxID=2811234 RepID=A0ABS3CHW2_9BACT|nr:methyltransferase domain-containing protein [Algoriphagus pacificus]MBN7816632.1 methyltransferase domain-containing protein [Algoriphagus pacificus]